MIVKKNHKTCNIKSLDFHVQSGDYFGTLATVLSLVKQSDYENMQKININILEKVEKDLMFLQNNYRIIKNK